MKRISDELKAIADAIVDSYRTGYSVSPSVLLKLANRAQDMELCISNLERTVEILESTGGKK